MSRVINSKNFPYLTIKMYTYVRIFNVCENKFEFNCQGRKPTLLAVPFLLSNRVNFAKQSIVNSDNSGLFYYFLIIADYWHNIHVMLIMFIIILINY